jgi:2-polyprenyl-3-methyl-5-hydroxy-6-metoxy-1,4-benzoquinol methylase
MQISEEKVIAGQSGYTPGVLAIYDIVVLRISNSFIWKCPSSRIEEHYNNNISCNHLDVGVGTGYFLDRCKFTCDQPRIALMDMNRNSLEFTSKRISRYKPEIYEQNILKPIESSIEPFDSIGLNYLFHCLPGDITYKAVALDHLIKIMNPNCKIFGSTILQSDSTSNWAAKKLMYLYNSNGAFSNAEDNLESLEYELSNRFKNVKIETIGCVALFSAEFR